MIFWTAVVNLSLKLAGLEGIAGRALIVGCRAHHELQAADAFLMHDLGTVRRIVLPAFIILAKGLARLRKYFFDQCRAPNLFKVVILAPRWCIKIEGRPAVSAGERHSQGSEQRAIFVDANNIAITGKGRHIRT